MSKLGQEGSSGGFTQKECDYCGGTLYHCDSCRCAKCGAGNIAAYVVQIAANEGQLIIPSLLMFIMAIAVAGVAFMIYPVLKKDEDMVNKKGLAESLIRGGVRVLLSDGSVR